MARGGQYHCRSTPRLSVLLSAPRSHARSRSSDILNRRSERRSDRSLIARSIRSPDRRAADASISAVGIRGEQGGTQGGTPPPREVFPCRLTARTWRRRIVVDVNAVRYLTASANFNQRCELLNVCTRFQKTSFRHQPPGQHHSPNWRRNAVWTTRPQPHMTECETSGAPPLVRERSLAGLCRWLYTRLRALTGGGSPRGGAYQRVMPSGESSELSGNCQRRE